jgi:hypothetical protein
LDIGKIELEEFESGKKLGGRSGSTRNRA